MKLDDASLPDYLRSRGLAARGDPVAVEAAGDGNINWVRRVRMGERSLVVKQARPALERFPEYQAPTERIVCEARYYERVRPLDDASVCPSVIAFDEPGRVLVLEDLGAAPRLDVALEAGADASDAARRVARFLGAVHAATAGDRTLRARFPNDGMRRLHGDHIFALPFAPNEFPLPQPVRSRAEAIWRNRRIAATAAEAHRAYLESDAALVHADVQAGNVLLAERGAVLLDAEIAHAGDPAFDLGTLFAHLWIAAVAAGSPAGATRAIEAARDSYANTNARFDEACEARAERYAALEMLRRTIGAARVAAVADPAASLRVIDFSLGLL